MLISLLEGFAPSWLKIGFISQELLDHLSLRNPLFVRRPASSNAKNWLPGGASTISELEGPSKFAFGGRDGVRDPIPSSSLPICEKASVLPTFSSGSSGAARPALPSGGPAL
jgi:hypothetical protein